MTAGALQIAVGGTAVVCCVHDREKRKVTDLAFDPARTKPHMCACCENLFLEPTDAELFCESCRGPLRHKLGGSLPDPLGVA